MSAHTEVIGGREYAFGTIPPTKAVRVEVAIGSIIGEALFRLVTTSKDPGEKQAAFSAAIGVMASKMDADTLLATMGLVFEYVTIDGNRIANIDSSFAGRNKDLWLAFIAALRANFADFFPESVLTSVRDQVPMSS